MGRNIEQQAMLLLLGWLQLQCGQAQRARVLLNALLCADPGNQQGRRALVVALLQLGEGSLAEQECEELLAAGLNTSDLWLCLSRARQLTGRIDAAQEAYQRFLNSLESDE